MKRKRRALRRRGGQSSVEDGVRNLEEGRKMALDSDKWTHLKGWRGLEEGRKLSNAENKKTGNKLE